MPTPSAQRLSQTEYLTDGVTTVWNFSFSGGYILSSHVKAYTEDIATGLRTEIVVTAPMLIGPFQIQITPVLAVGSKLVIYRDTPKDLPLVDFTDESGFSEVSLDTNAKQAVFVAAETQDAVGTFSTAAAGAAAAAAIAAAADAESAAITANSAAAAAAISAAAISLPLSVANGGTGSTNATSARAAIAAAASGANTDITSIQASAIPAASITQARLASNVAGNGPVFMVTTSASQSIPHNVADTKLIFQTEVYDTAACFDNVTNYRFTPNVAGFYQVNVGVEWSGTSGRIYLSQLQIRKNNVIYVSNARSITQNTGNQEQQHLTALVYLNGSTDYLEAFMYQNDFTGSAAVTKSSTTGNYFQGYLARAA